MNAIDIVKVSFESRENQPISTNVVCIKVCKHTAAKSDRSCACYARLLFDISQFNHRRLQYMKKHQQQQQQHTVRERKRRRKHNNNKTHSTILVIHQLSHTRRVLCALKVNDCCILYGFCCWRRSSVLVRQRKVDISLLRFAFCV